jgi:hypothetical protein
MGLLPDSLFSAFRRLNRRVLIDSLENRFQ